MRVPHFLVLLFGLFVVVALSSCSRESSVKENVNLKNNHSRVFVFDSPIQDPQAFADSMANTVANNTDTIPDTLTVTINDSVYLIGLLPYNIDKIYRFQWTLTKKDGKDTTIIGNNAKPQAWAYAKPGIYEPKFVAFDGNNATDTAGTATRKALVRVIDTKPFLKVPKDTLWTRHDGNITFPILVSDSFGTVVNIKVDLDASGKKDSAVVWKYETFEENDSLYLTIKNDPTKMDSLGNQKIYVIATDDDGNATKDSVNLHFNRIPRLKVIYPQDGARHSISNRFYFYYEGEDDDNPEDLKYFIYAQVSKNGQPPQKAFTTDDLIASDFSSTIFEPRDKNDSNIITLLKDPDKQLTGRIYWDMYVTDGYDPVWLKRIVTGENSSRPWTFYIGDLSSTQGTFTGVAKYQGRDEHAGIRVEYTNGNKIFDTYTDDKGNYSLKVDVGSYTASAQSENAKEYKAATLSEMFIESGNTIKADDMLLKDTVLPVLMVDKLDSTTERTLLHRIYARDMGSYLDNVTIKIDGKEQTLSCSKEDKNTVFNCNMTIKDISDGVHKFEYSAKDKAGNASTFNQNLAVHATQINLNVNGGQSARIDENGTLTFTAKISNDYPTAAGHKITWSYELNNGKQTSQSNINDNGTATFTLKYNDIKNIATAGNSYYMTAAYKDNGANVSAKVKFGILGDEPSVSFIMPNPENTVSINDVLHFKVQTYKGRLSNTVNLTWTCGSNISAGYTCPTANTEEADLAFSKAGKYEITATVTDDLNKTGSETVIVNVVNDPPTIDASTKSKTNEYKIGAIVDVDYTAKDKFGTVNKIKWGCSNGNVNVDENEKIFDNPQKSVTGKLQIKLPGGSEVADMTKHKCIFKAIDDDNEFGLDTIVFTLLKDPPTVRLATKNETVKINSDVVLKAIATDKLGYIAEYRFACNSNLSQLNNPENWEVSSSAQKTVTMPAAATEKYYCKVQVKDDDGNTATDMATYKVVNGLPTVKGFANYNRVTIRDVIDLNAHAQDSLGTLVKYEWGCGSATAQNIAFTYSSTSTPSTKMTMPKTAQNNYRCVVRVTDDDDNTAMDTIRINIILAPPTIALDNDSLTVREGFNITLGAQAFDNNGVNSDPGEIVLRQWSCGRPSQITNNWKTVSSFDTLWKAPSQYNPFYCVARAMDNDSNFVSDTIHVGFSSEELKLNVVDELIYVNPGDAFTLDARVNNVWQGILWFSWECKEKASGKSMEKTVVKYDYNLNGQSFRITKDSTYSERNLDMLCSVTAQEKSTGATMSATTEVRILKHHPKGVISAADTVYLWSGDLNVEKEAMYFYTPEWGGYKSQIGTDLGDANNQDFWWQFSNVDSKYYQGKKDGSFDVDSTYEFNMAFIRLTHEGQITIHLDYRDSTMKEPTQAFLNRHRAEDVSRTVYFRKAWRNQGNDTVIAKSTIDIAPAMVTIGDKPYVAYLSDTKKVTLRKLDGNTWTEVHTLTVDKPITLIRLCTNGSDIFMGLLKNDNTFSVYKSAGGTSQFATLGSSLTNVIHAQIAVKKASGTNPFVVLASNNSNATQNISLYKYNNNKWENANISFKQGTYKNVDAIYAEKAFENKDKIVIMATNNDKDTIAYYGYYESDYSLINTNGFSALHVSQMSLYASGGKIYMPYYNHGLDYGPFVFDGKFEKGQINWDKNGLCKKPILDGQFTNKISVTVKNDTLYAAIDGRISSKKFVNVYKYVNGAWHLHGENQLPYFKTSPQRGMYPTLQTSNNSLYLLMLSRNNNDESGKNNGPLVMKYVADNWKVHE